MRQVIKNEPPFYGTRLVNEVPLDKLYPLIDTRLLFSKEWQFRRTPHGVGMSADWIEKEARPAFEELKETAITAGYLHPQVIFGHFDRSELDVSIMDEKILARIPENSLPLQLVTIGDEVQRRCLYPVFGA
jgi:cobalamin-dependent methionine synthase I